MDFATYISPNKEDILRNLCISAALFASAEVWSLMWTKIHSVSRRDVRKIIHMTGGPMMMFSWALYVDPPSICSRLIAALVPLLFSVQFFISSEHDPICTGTSRSGDANEARKGPLAYCLSLALTVIFFGPASKKTYALMAALMGDGMADIVGSRVRGRKWAAKSHKSVPGTIANAVGCFISLILFLKFAQSTGLSVETMGLIETVFISIGCAAVEAVDGMEDNYSVPLAAVTLASVF